jgi:hypothetical protein
MTATDKPEQTTTISLKAPTEFFERLDRWRERRGEGFVMKPSRPASIRWIVHRFLLSQEQKTARPQTGKRRRPKAGKHK